MAEAQQEYVLPGNQYFLSDSPGTIYRLTQGEVEVYVIPVRGNTKGEPKFYCTIRDTDANRAIPALFFQDADGCCWHLLVKNTGKPASFVSLQQSSTVPYRKFLQRRNISTFETLGFEQSLIAFYNKLIIDRTQTLLSSSPKEVCKVEEGSVYVYIVPMEKGQPGKPVYYCEISSDDPDPLIPGLACRDQGGREWRLQLRASSEEAVLNSLNHPAEDLLLRAFLQRRNIKTFEREGFENSLIDFYTHELVKEKRSIIQHETSGSSSARDVVNVVKSSFSSNSTSDLTGAASFRALQYVCDNQGISLPGQDVLIARCGKDPKIADIAKVCNLICRQVVLEENWHRRDCGCLIGTLDKEIVACVPGKKGGYQILRTGNGTITQLTEETARSISPKAYSIGRALPLKALNKRDIISFCARSIHSCDLTPYIVLCILCSLIGVLLPTLNGMIYDDYIPVGNVGNLMQLCLVMLTFMIGNLSFSIVKNLFGYRITSRVGIDLQNAVYHRLFQLPESFFRRYDSADLAGRISGIGQIASSFANTVVVSGISALFSCFYLIRMFSYNAKLTWLCLGIYAVYLIIIVALTSLAHKGQLRILRAQSESGSKLYQYLSGVDKIRMAGVEDRAILSYMRPFARAQQEQIRLNRLTSIEQSLGTVISYVFSMILYWYIVRKVQPGNISIGTFVAFNSAFGSFTGALDSVIDEVLRLVQQRSELRRFWPIFQTAPEDDDAKEIPGELSGSLTLDHVSFAYDSNSGNVLNDLSVHIRPGEYVGIVGPSGCGKSTLLKLLLGFETPQKGEIRVDKKDLRSLNKGAYRRQLGVVLQNGKLISGSIYENITITAPEATHARVNEVVQQVGLKEEIEQMPMGLHTMLSENCSTISGGQQQRILIARAICGNPKILLFDEATSALDNVTQAAVSESLDKMNVTRIVIAHRLSTIQHCDRILVMKDGRIIQEGTYESLMRDTDGLFHDLAVRQIAQ